MYKTKDRREMNRFRLGLGLLALLGLPATGLAGPIHATHKWAWSENAGYLNFRATNATVSSEHEAAIHPDGDHGYMSGWAWSEMVGWIKLGNTNGGGPYANTDATNWGVNFAGSNVSGFAWSENAGWLNFAPTHATATNRVTVALTNGQFDGYAWNELAGWVHVRGMGEAPLYALQSEAPTLLVLYDFHLREENGQMWVCWITDSEEMTVGFDLYRWTDEAWVKVNDALSPGRGAMGGSYRISDAAANATDTFRYQLVETETDGTPEEYGPFDVAAINPRMEYIAVAPDGIVLRWPSREQDTYEVQKSLGLTNGFAPLATGLPGILPANAYTDQVENAGAAYYRIRVE